MSVGEDAAFDDAMNVTEEMLSKMKLRSSTGSTADDHDSQDNQSTAASEGSAIMDSEGFCRQQVLSLCTELLNGFSEQGFQQKLTALLEDEKASAARKPGRLQLALEVQKEVLPRYGFAGDSTGVVKMLEAIRPFLSNWMILHLVNEIDEALGLPKNSTANMMTGKSSEEKMQKPESEPFLCRHQALALCAELHTAFSTPEFQKELREKLGSPGQGRHSPVRMMLAMRVQEKVLPKYGLLGNHEGVRQMLVQIRPFLGDWMVNHLVEAIDESLLLPPRSTADMCQNL